MKPKLKIPGVNPAICAMLERRGFRRIREWGNILWLTNSNSGRMILFSDAVLECHRLTHNEKQRRYRAKDPATWRIRNREYQRRWKSKMHITGAETIPCELVTGRVK